MDDVEEMLNFDHYSKVAMSFVELECVDFERTCNHFVDFETRRTMEKNSDFSYCADVVDY